MEPPHVGCYGDEAFPRRAGDARVVAVSEVGEELGSRVCVGAAGERPRDAGDELWFAAGRQLADKFRAETVKEFDLHLHGADAFCEREFCAQRGLLEGGLAEFFRQRHPLRAGPACERLRGGEDFSEGLCRRLGVAAS
jgi:hypothetical protein